MTEKELAVCDECGSLFFKGSSQMMGLCPECAHILYGYPNCDHHFQDGRCVNCYSNVSDEHMIAMTVAAIQLHREQELIEELTKEQARIRAENGLPQRDRFCDILMDYLKRGVMPFADNDKNYPYPCIYQ